MMPLTVTEFANAALSFPVIFVGEERQPVAVMGLREGENLFFFPTGDRDDPTPMCRPTCAAIRSSSPMTTPSSG